MAGVPDPGPDRVEGMYAAPPVSLEGLPRPGRALVMGVLNVTPDSFSDGGLFVERGHVAVDRAVEHGLRLRDEGADLLDVGGESTRPGATRPVVAEELERVVPVIEALVAEDVCVSVDTMRAEVALAAARAGASVVNDVSGGLADPEMMSAVAESGAAYIAMHWRGHSTVMQQRASYGDVVVDVRAELAARVDAALGAGIAEDRICVDPGLGFAKTAEHNWELLRRLPELDALGLPILVGSSRKSFLGTLLAAPDGSPRPVGEREDATVALTTIAGLIGVWGVRVHQVRGSLDALRVSSRWLDRGCEDVGGRG